MSQYHYTPDWFLFISQNLFYLFLVPGCLMNWSYARQPALTLLQHFTSKCVVRRHELSTLSQVNNVVFTAHTSKFKFRVKCNWGKFSNSFLGVQASKCPKTISNLERKYLNYESKMLTWGQSSVTSWWKLHITKVQSVRKDKNKEALQKKTIVSWT